MDKKTIAFVFFGQNRVEKFVIDQIKEINEAKKIFSSKLEFYILDATRNGIESKNNLS